MTHNNFRMGHAACSCDLIVRKKQFPPVFWQRLYNYEATSGSKLIAEVIYFDWRQYCSLHSFMHFTILVFIKWADRGLFLIYFRLFKHTLNLFLQQIHVSKCPSSIWCRDWNSRPLEHESPPIITRPGLPPYDTCCLIFFNFFYLLKYSKHQLFASF